MKNEKVTVEPRQLVLNIIAQAPKAPRPVKAGKGAKALQALVERKPMKITPEAVSRVRLVKRRPEKAFDANKVFSIVKPAPGVVPKGDKVLAMDEAWSPTVAWAAGNTYNFAFEEGYTFLGFPYLSQLAQVPEYRVISEVISTEATRKWIKIKSTGDDDDDKAEQIQELEDEFERLAVREVFEKVSFQDGIFGRAHLYIDTGDGDNQPELMTPIGDGAKFSSKKFKKGFLRGLKTVEPVWTYPQTYNARNPLADDWYKPVVWYVMSQGIHVTRLLPFVSRPVPDLIKPAFSFAGLSMSQMAKPYIDNWLTTRESVNNIIQNFSTMVLKTDLSTILQGGNGDPLATRLDLFNGTRTNGGVMALDKNTEDFGVVTASLASLDKLQAQAQEHMAAVSRIPLVKLLGISPSGLNATADPELRCFYDTIHAYQEKFFGPHLTTIFRLAQLNIWGKVDPDLMYDFEPLWELDEKSIVEMQKFRAETHEKYIGMGAVDGENVREALKADPNAPYPSIDPSEEPDIEVEPEKITEKLGGESEGGEAGPGEPAGPKSPDPAPEG